MWTRTIALATYLITVTSVKGWFSASPHRRMLHSGGFGSRSAIISSRDDDTAPIITIEDTWPQLAGKQTSATAAAGKVIREAWAAEAGNQSSGSWTIQRQVVEYRDGDITLEGLYARPEGVGLPERIPGVIIAHTAVGIPEDFILWKLDSIARLGYAAFALDMFGARRALWDRSESIAARRPITENRSLLQTRAVTAVETLRRLDGVDSNCLAAIGYCFGGMVVLDLARVSPPIPGLRAVASLHGILAPMLPGAGKDPAAENASVGPRVLVLHAIDDPFVPHEQVQAMEEEFARRQANIEIVKYGGKARHAFTRPEKTGKMDMASGLSYDKHADVDSWQRVIGLLREELA